LLLRRLDATYSSGVILARRVAIIGAQLVVAGIVGIVVPLPSSGATPAELVYVANQSDPVTAYAASSSGSVVPAVQIPNPSVPNTVWIPWTVALDKTGLVYAQTFLSLADTFVFAPRAGVAPAPQRIFPSHPTAGPWRSTGTVSPM
jgi:hypothetical protein